MRRSFRFLWRPDPGDPCLREVEESLLAESEWALHIPMRPESRQLRCSVPESRSRRPRVLRYYRECAYVINKNPYHVSRHATEPGLLLHVRQERPKAWLRSQWIQCRIFLEVQLKVHVLPR